MSVIKRSSSHFLTHLDIESISSGPLQKRVKNDEAKIQAAIVIQRAFRAMQKRTYDPNYLFENYQKRNKNDPTKTEPLTIHQLDVSKPENYGTIIDCLRLWTRFSKKQLEENKEFSEALKNQIGAIKDLSEHTEWRLNEMLRKIRLKKTKCLPTHIPEVIVAKDEQGKIEAISVFRSGINSPTQFVISLISSPLNMIKREQGESHVSGAAAALLGFAALQSKRTLGTLEAPAVILESISSSNSFYEKIGFKKVSGKNEGDEYTDLLKGEPLRQLLRNYCGRAQIRTD